mgnify:CR=1 FL=1
MKKWLIFIFLCAIPASGVGLLVSAGNWQEALKLGVLLVFLAVLIELVFGRPE